MGQAASTKVCQGCVFVEVDSLMGVKFVYGLFGKLHPHVEPGVTVIAELTCAAVVFTKCREGDLQDLGLIGKRLQSLVDPCAGSANLAQVSFGIIVGVLSSAAGVSRPFQKVIGGTEADDERGLPAA